MPSRSPHKPSVWLVVAMLLGAALGAMAPGQAAVAHPKAKAGPAAAEAALAHARSVMSGRSATRGQSTGRDATMVLRRLAQVRSQLDGTDLAAADRLLARPALEDHICTPANCYHWTTTGPDAVSTTDEDGNDIPDYVDQVAQVVDHVRATYVSAGYRAPEPDGTRGGNSKTDIYLEDDGADGLYGYCTSDKRFRSSTTTFDAWAYCSLDNDYSPSQFPSNTPVENLRVTAAHEYFHAVQFAYDFFEDSWFMEATATWAEDELYDSVDDNLQYLADSPLTKPWQPLDTFIDGPGPQYGDWIFFRFLTEAMPTSVGGLPTLVRDMWRRADGAAGGPDDYSIQAVRRVLGNRGTSLPRELTRFAVANRRPRATYEEGAVNDYPSTGPARTVTLSTDTTDSQWRTTTRDHLSSATVRFVPGTGLTSTAWKLRISLNLPATSKGSAAAVTVYPSSGQPKTTLVSLNTSGDATARVAFGSSAVKYVEATLVNGDTSYSCWTNGPYSCQGSSNGDGEKLSLRALAVQ